MLRTFWFASGLVLIASIDVYGSGPVDRIFHTVLTNGLEVIAIENPTVPLVTVEIDVRNGAFTEPPEFDGLSHLFEHMFFKANESISNQERFLERSRELGLTFNATTNEENVNYYFTVLRDSLEPSLAFMKAAITTPLFLEEELNKERHVVIDEYDRNDSNPQFHLYTAVNKKLWYKYYSRKNPIGEREVILTATPEKMRTILKKYYIPNNSALLISGDVKHETVFGLAEKYFSDWLRGPAPFPDDRLSDGAIPYPPELQKSDTVIVEQPVNNISIMLSWQGPSVTVNTSATYAADVFTFIMNHNSKFPSILMSSGLFTSISFSYQTLNYKGPFTIVAETSPEKFQRARTALFEELKYLIRWDYFTDEQIDYAKTRLEVQDMYEWERPSQFAQSLGYWWSITGGLDYYKTYLENLRKVTRADINDLVKKYIQNAPYVLGILISPENREKLGLNRE
jgi:zinc protease